MGGEAAGNGGAGATFPLESSHLEEFPCRCLVEHASIQAHCRSPGGSCQGYTHSNNLHPAERIIHIFEIGRSRRQTTPRTCQDWGAVFGSGAFPLKQVCHMQRITPVMSSPTGGAAPGHASPREGGAAPGLQGKEGRESAGMSPELPLNRHVGKQVSIF